MATLALPPAPPAFVFRLDDGQNGFLAGHGPEALSLLDKAEEALTHFRQRAEFLIGSSVSGDELSYTHMPLSVSFTVRTRYRFVGRMKPRAIGYEGE